MLSVIIRNHKRKVFAKQCDYQETSKGDPTQHKIAVHEGAKYPCRQCNYKETKDPSCLTQKAEYEGMG